MSSGASSRPRATNFDPFDMGYIADAYPTLARLHVESPVFYFDPLDIWFVTKYDDVKAIASDYKTFSSRAVGFVTPPADIAARLPDPKMDEIIIATDPPIHTAIRQPVTKTLGQAFMTGLEGLFRQTATTIIDRFIEKGQGNLMSEFCYPMSLTSMVVLFGLPPERASDYRRWSDDVLMMLTVKNLDGEQERKHPMPDDELRERWTRLIEANLFFRDYVSKLKDNPGNDLASAMLKVKDDKGDPALPFDTVVRNIAAMIAAGHDTTANLLGQLLLMFAKHPDQFEIYRKDPALLSNAIDETLRRRGSATTVLRVATQDVEIRGVKIPRGSHLALMLSGANVDEEHFPNAGMYDITRTNADKNLTFGIGRHSCLGNRIARMQAQIAAEELFRRIETVEFSSEEPASYLPQFTALNLTRLDMNWRAN